MRIVTVISIAKSTVTPCATIRIFGSLVRRSGGGSTAPRGCLRRPVSFSPRRRFRDHPRHRIRSTTADADAFAKADALESWSTPVVACTVDTVLGLVQNNRRGLFAWPALAQSAFVFDEIHAYVNLIDSSRAPTYSICASGKSTARREQPPPRTRPPARPGRSP